MPAQMQLVRDDDQQIKFTNPWKWGLVISFGGLLIGFLVLSKPIEGFTYWVLVGGIALTVVIGLLAFLTRDELMLDVVSRAYTRRGGYWPAVKSQTGSLNDFRALLLTTELRTNPRGGQYPTWVITLQTSGVQPTIALVEFRNESQAYGKLELWSRKLGLPASESTAGREQRLEFTPASQQQPSELRSTSLPSLPLGSKLGFVGTAPARTIVLPPLGLSLGVLIFAVFPAITLWMGIAGYDEAVHHVPPRSTGFAIAVICFGILLVLALLFAMFGRTTVREQDDNILIGNRAFGWNYNVKSVAKRDIEDVEIKPTPLSSVAPVFTLSGLRVLRPRSPRSRTELFVRSRTQVMRIGQELSPEDLRWLQQAVLDLARS